MGLILWFHININKSVKWGARMMHPIFCFLLLVCGYCSAQTIPADSAKYYEGWLMTVCDTIAEVLKRDSKTVYFNFQAKYPNQSLTVVVFDKDSVKLPESVYDFLNKRVCISGMIKMYRGKPEIIVRDERQIRIPDRE